MLLGGKCAVRQLLDFREKYASDVSTLQRSAAFVTNLSGRGRELPKLRGAGNLRQRPGLRAALTSLTFGTGASHVVCTGAKDGAMGS